MQGGGKGQCIDAAAPELACQQGAKFLWKQHKQRIARKERSQHKQRSRHSDSKKRCQRENKVTATMANENG